MKQPARIAATVATILAGTALTSGLFAWALALTFVHGVGMTAAVVAGALLAGDAPVRLHRHLRTPR